MITHHTASTHRDDRTTRRRWLPAVVLGALSVLATLAPLAATPAAAATRTSGLFADDDRSVHEGQIEALAVEGITSGCGIGRFCPHEAVTRGQMAAFLDRALSLPRPSRDWFRDDERSRFEASIDRLREDGATRGCNPPANDRFCPERPVTRGQMAVFLTEALDLPASDRDWFVDDDGHMFESAIQALRRAGITRGCNPPANDRFCPDETVSRAQMASFISRVRGLSQPWPLDGSVCRTARFTCRASADWHPVALRWGDIDLRLPSSATEMIGFHQANHDGARNLTSTTDVRTLTMPSRGRGTGSRSAADVVVHPRVEIRSPVTGTVVRSGTYTLYCRYSDDYAVIRPDGRPGIEVKMLHIDGVRVRPGDRVEAGVTVLARGPTPLPFASQVDRYSAPADWPHVHVEVVDTSIPDIPGGGGGC